MTKLFNERALRRRHTVGDQTGPISILTPPLRATLLLGVLIAAAGGVWSIMARIPVNVKGIGVLLPVSTINAILSGTDGSAVHMFNKPVEAWHGEALAFMQSPKRFNDQEVLALATSIYEASQSSNNASGVVSRKDASTQFNEDLKKTYQGFPLPEGRLLVWVRSTVELERLSTAIDQLQRSLEKVEKETANINLKQTILRDELQGRASYLESMKKLASKGYVSKQSILQEQSEVDRLRSQIHSNNNERIRARSELDKVFKNLRDETSKVVNLQLIYSQKDVYLASIIPNDGESVLRGRPVLELSETQLDAPALVPVFLSGNEAAQVFPGMSALATPAGYKRSEVGGIQSKVVSMAKLPSGLSEVSARIGVKDLASTITARHPAPTLAILALDRSSDADGRNTGGYRWSSNSALPFPPTPGVRLDVQITTRKVAPITFVMPAVRKFFGLVPPDQPDVQPQSSPTNDQSQGVRQ